MNIVIEFITGIVVGIEFPGDGLHCVVHVGPLRLMFVSEEYMEGVE